MYNHIDYDLVTYSRATCSPSTCEYHDEPDSRRLLTDSQRRRPSYRHCTPDYGESHVLANTDDSTRDIDSAIWQNTYVTGDAELFSTAAYFSN